MMKINQYTALLAKEREVDYNKSLNNVEAVADLLRQAFHADQQPVEHFWQICLNGRLNVVGLFETSIGTQQVAMVDLPTIARNALLTGASSVIVAHNHPSGSLEVSALDKRTTKEIRDALGLFEIKLVDHIIIAQNGIISIITTDKEEEK